MFNQGEFGNSIGQHALQVQRTGRRLLFSAIGFSAAYFLDPAQGPARRRAAMAAFHRAKQALAAMRADDVQRTGARGEEAPEPAVANAPLYPAEGLKVAR